MVGEMENGGRDWRWRVGWKKIGMEEDRDGGREGGREGGRDRGSG